MSEPVDPFFCGYCLESSGMDERPEVCPICKVGFCQKCYSKLKAGSRWCHGCGTFSPTVRSNMYRSSSIAGFYASEGWERDGRTNKKSVFRVWGFSMLGDLPQLSEESTEPETNPPSVLNKRDLTPEEMVIMGYEPMTQEEWKAKLASSKHKKATL